MVIGIGVVSLIIAVIIAQMVLKKDTGTDAMRAISDAIREGAEAFLRRQYRTIGMLSIVLAVVIFVLYGFVRELNNVEKAQGLSTMGARDRHGHLLHPRGALLGRRRLHRHVGRRSAPTSARPRRPARSLNDALQTALRGGAVSGLFVVAMCLLGVGGLFAVLLYGFHVTETQIPFMIVGYGFGASFVALFAQLGGGIYTKAADVGADLVGKVEAGIPEDDPRNPAVIADLVGDNVGDCAGRGADLFESTAAENIGAMILGVALGQPTATTRRWSSSSRSSPAPSASSPPSSASSSCSTRRTTIRWTR